MLAENFIFIDGAAVKEGICKKVSMYTGTDSHFDITSISFNSKKVYEDEIFNQQEILKFFSWESKDYKCLKSSQMLYTLTSITI